jgi:hypothetical protein
MLVFGEIYLMNIQHWRIKYKMNETMTSEVNQTIGYRDVLKQKEYMKLIFANIINRFGDSIDSIAFTWLVFSLTGSAAWSAIIFGINRVPTIFYNLWPELWLIT